MSMGNVGNMPLILLTFAVVSIVGVLVFSNVFDSLPALTGTANTTVFAFADSFYSGIGLLGVALIVLGAAAIIAIVKML